MSGQQIGTVVGGLIGAYFGGPAGAQLGMAIGGAIGGAIDPTKIYGPKIGDGQQQTATDGSPIAWVQGTAAIAGTIVQVSKRRQVRHKDNGKGSGTEQVTYTAAQDFAILVCESCELRDSTVASVLMVYQDGKLVYDVRPGSTMTSDSAKWKANVDFLYGDENQMPHPTLEAITGVGNTPAYRGSLIAVFKDFNVSQAGDRIPAFSFVVSNNAPIFPTQSEWRYYPTTLDDDTDFSSPTFDDSSWLVGRAPFGDYTNGTPPNLAVGPHTYDGRLSEKIATSMALDTRMWLRKTFNVSVLPTDGFTMIGWLDNSYDLYINGVLARSETEVSGGGTSAGISAAYFTLGVNYIAVRCSDDLEHAVNDVCYFDFLFEPQGTDDITPVPVPLDTVVRRVCERGGLIASDVDVTALSTASVIGYPIATQANAADCLLPLLQANFAYASEYDTKLNFKFYGADAEVVIDRADLIEGNSTEGTVVESTRNQATEYPRRIVARYIDPAQNYTAVNVTAERRAADVTAIGDQTLAIPVVMDANTAAQAADKALKIAYAALEGTQKYSTPFAGTDAYLTLAAGDPLIFQGRRYVVDEVVLGRGTLEFSTTYSRQSAYTSNVQAIVGNAPTPPQSRYSGPTLLIPMNLPSQRPQDSVGVYIAAASSIGSDSWRGCTVQVSYDNQVSWTDALTITMESEVGAIGLDEPGSGEPITIDMLKYDLTSATTEQLAAGSNAFAVTDSTGNTTQLAQFATAAETTTDKQFEVNGVSRSLGGTAAFGMTAGDSFTMMDAAYFLPINAGFAGRTIYFRGVGFGEAAEDATIYPLVYAALVTPESAQFVSESGTYAFVTEDGAQTFYAE